MSTIEIMILAFGAGCGLGLLYKIAVARHKGKSVIDAVLNFPAKTDFVSTRPACPICKKGSLTGELYDAIGETFVVICQNKECYAHVVINKHNWKVVRAERYYFPNGDLIP